MEYRSKVIRGFAWSAAEKFATTAIRIAASVLILRFISPAQFGVVELLAVFSLIAHTIIDSGFGQALIRKQDADEKDYNSIFYLNTGIAAVLYLLLTGLAYPLSWWFGEPELTYYAPVLFLALPISALGLIQTTILSRQMDFKTLSKISLTATVISSAVLIGLALAGFGAWALVLQSVANETVKTSCLWLAGSWRPRRMFSMESVRELYKFGSRLFLTGIITTVFNRISTLIIGSMHNTAQVGLYNQSLKFKDGIATALTNSVHNVSYPALASFQDDEAKLRLATRQVVQVLSFILFPAMAGLILVAPEGFALAGGEKWIPAIPYFQIFCISAFFLPLSNASINILRAKGMGGTILKAEIIKKCFAAVIITFAAFRGITALAWAYTVWMAFEMCVNAYYAKRTNGYGYRLQLSDTLPYLAMSAVMFATVEVSVWLIATAAPEFFHGPSLAPVGIIFALKIIIAVIAYTLLGAIFRPAAWKEAIPIVKGATTRR